MTRLQKTLNAAQQEHPSNQSVAKIDFLDCGLLRSNNRYLAPPDVPTVPSTRACTEPASSPVFTVAKVCGQCRWFSWLLLCGAAGFNQLNFDLRCRRRTCIREIMLDDNCRVGCKLLRQCARFYCAGTK